MNDPKTARRTFYGWFLRFCARFGEAPASLIHPIRAPGRRCLSDTVDQQGLQ